MKKKIIIVGLESDSELDAFRCMLNELMSDNGRLIRFLDQENELGDETAQRVKKAAAQRIALCQRLMKAQFAPHPQYAVVKHESDGQSTIIWS